MNENIFVVGGTVQAKNGLYVSRRADKELLNLCRLGSFAYVLTPRQLGKSSLMESTATLLAREGIRSVIITLETIGAVGVTVEKWYLGLLVIIADQLMLDTDVMGWWKAHSHLGVTQRFTAFFEKVLLAEVKEQMVIFVDEIDTTLSLSFTDDFFAAIRYFHNARAHLPEFNRLSFVLIGCATPGDLIRDPQRTPFNIGQRVDLADFTLEEALPLTAGLGLDDEQARQTLGWVMKWTNGHPYLTQLMCRTLAAQSRVGWTEADVDAVVADTLFHTVKEPDENLKFVRDMLTKRAPDRDNVLTTYRKIRMGKQPVLDEEQSLVKNHLKLSGVVRREHLREKPNEKIHDGHSEKIVLQLRNPIYSEVFNEAWVKEHMPISWFARAKQSGVLIVAVLLAISVFVLLGAKYKAEQRIVKVEHEAEIAQQRAKDLVNQIVQTQLDVKLDYTEYQKHARPELNADPLAAGPSADSPVETQTVYETRERGSLKVDLFADNAVRVKRKGPEPGGIEVKIWVPSPPKSIDAAPGPVSSSPGELSGAASESPSEDRTGTREPINPQFRLASFTAPGPLPGEPAGQCLNPHPGAFKSWYGQKNGCWVAVYRQWPDGCTHYQWYNACYNTWDAYPNGAPKVYWTACVH